MCGHDTKEVAQFRVACRLSNKKGLNVETLKPYCSA